MADGPGREVDAPERGVAPADEIAPGGEEAPVVDRLRDSQKGEELARAGGDGLGKRGMAGRRAGQKNDRVPPEREQAGAGRSSRPTADDDGLRGYFSVRRVYDTAQFAYETGRSGGSTFTDQSPELVSEKKT